MTTTRWKVLQRDKNRDIFDIVEDNKRRLIVLQNITDEGLAHDIVREHNAHAVNEKARLTLEGLTPGGSEYANDPERCAMTTYEAKKDCAARLRKHGIGYTKLTARTVNFQDLARCSPVFVTVTLSDYLSIPKETIEEGIPKPSEGGYCIEYRKGA